MPAVAVHHTATSDSAWDGSAAEKALGTDPTMAELKDVYAWVPSGSDPTKSECKFPHHFVTGGKPGAASTVACSAVVAALNGGRGGTTIPDADRRGVYNHVIAHLKDAGVKEADLPELKASRRPLTTRSLLDPRFEQRRERRSGMRGRTERRMLQFERGAVELRAAANGTGGTAYRFTGYAAVFDAPFEMWDWWGDPYVEVVNQGAFSRTLNANPDVPFLIGHDDGGIALARTRSGTMMLSQDSTGLHVEVPALDGRSPLVQSLASAIERGDMDEMSCAFITRDCMWSPDYEQRNMLEMDLHRGDVSVVVSPANPAANGAAVESVALSSGRPLDRRMPTQPYTRGADESVTCPQCQSGNDTDARYCDQCGTALMPTTPYQRKSDETQMCESCSCWNAPDAKVCDQCGRSLVNDHDADDGYYARRRPERRDSDEIMDTSSAPDYNPGGHSDSSIQCPHPDCTVEGGAMNAQDARFCDQCGGPLYDEDGLIVLDDSGVAEEVVEGSVGDSSALSLHRARLEMLRLR